MMRRRRRSLRRAAADGFIFGAFSAAAFSANSSRFIAGRPILIRSTPWPRIRPIRFSSPAALKATSKYVWHTGSNPRSNYRVYIDMGYFYLLS